MLGKSRKFVTHRISRESVGVGGVGGSNYMPWRVNRHCDYPGKRLGCACEYEK